MPRWAFDIVAEGEDCLERLETAFEGSAHACVTERYGLAVVAFDVEDGSARDALAWALDEMRGAGVEIRGIEPGRLATLADVAAVAGISACRMEALASEVSDPPFPLPVARVTAGRPIWDMLEVADWMSMRGLLPSRAAEFVAAAAEAASGIEARRRSRTERPPEPAGDGWQDRVLRAACARWSFAGRAARMAAGTKARRS